MCAEGTDCRLPVLAVLGAAAATPEQEAVAYEVGRLAARHGWVVLTGGGPGVMAAASRGAVETGGMTVGVLPVARATVDYPNPWVRIPVYTGAGMARNAFNVLSGTLCMAIGGGAGTLSEVALALKAGVEVWWWGGWRVEAPAGGGAARIRRFESGEELLGALAAVLVGGSATVR